MLTLGLVVLVLDISSEIFHSCVFVIIVVVEIVVLVELVLKPQKQSTGCHRSGTGWTRLSVCERVRDHNHRPDSPPRLPRPS